MATVSEVNQLDEVALRKPGFTSGYKVVLGDGQEWTFPKPILRIFPVLGADGEIETRSASLFGDRYDALVDELLETDADDEISRISHQVKIAAHLLLQNYDLDNFALCQLLVFDFNEPGVYDRWIQITNILMGRAPKATPDGSD